MSNIVKIRLLLDFNIPGSGYTPLTQNLFYISAEEREQGQEQEQGPEPSNKPSLSALPFFSYHVKYSTEHLKKMTHAECVRTFFSKQLFEEHIMHYKKDIVTDKETQHENAKHNLRVMVQFLFPTLYPIRDNIHSTYDETILRQSTDIDRSYSILPDFVKRIFSQNVDQPNAVLQLQGGAYSVTGVTIVDDIVHSPIYRNYMEKIRQFEVWRTKKMGDLKNVNDQHRRDVVALFDKTLNDVKTEPGKNKIDKEMAGIIQRFERSTTSGVDPELLKKILDDLHTELNKTPIDNDKIQSLLFEIYKLNSRKGSYQRSFLPNTLDTREFLYLLDKNATCIIERTIVDEYFVNPKKIYDLLNSADKSKTTNDEVTEIIRGKLKKYPEWTYVFELIKSMIPPRRSVTNTRLQNVFGSFVSNIETSITLLQLVEKVHLYISSPRGAGTLDAFTKQFFELGVVITSDTNKSNVKKDFTFEVEENNIVEVYLLVDLVKGVLTPQSLKDILCVYKNAVLVEKYRELRHPNKSSTSIYRPPLLNIDSMAKEGNSKKHVSSITEQPVSNRTRRQPVGKIVGGFVPGDHVPSVQLQSSPSQSNVRKNRRKRPHTRSKRKVPKGQISTPVISPLS